MNHISEKPVVAIAQARRFEHNDSFFLRHDSLVRRLRDYGVLAIALNGVSDRTDRGDFSTFYTFNQVARSLDRHDTPLTVHSALDLTGGIARYAPNVSALNPLGVREIVLSKQLQYDKLRPHFGDAVPQTTIANASKDNIVSAIDSMSVDTYVIKADTDNLKAHRILIGKKDAVISQLDSLISTMNPEKDKVVVQEYMSEVEGSYIEGISYSDDGERQIADDPEVYNRELRVHTIDGRAILVTGRTVPNDRSDSARDKWVYLDQNSIPSCVTDLASTVAQVIQEAARATDSYLAVDLTPDGRRVVEVNGRNIETMLPETGRPGSVIAAQVTTDALARKLVGLAHENKGTQ